MVKSLSETLESFLNFCDSLANTHIRWIADPSAYKRNTLHVTVEHFLSDCEHFFKLEMFKAHAEQPACKLLKELYEKIDTYQSDEKTWVNLLMNEKLLSDPNWIKIQTLAKRIQEALSSLVKEKRSLE